MCVRMCTVCVKGPKCCPICNKSHFHLQLAQNNCKRQTALDGLKVECMQLHVCVCVCETDEREKRVGERRLRKCWAGFVGLAEGSA